MKLTIETECGETTCASEPGKFCGFLRTSHWGTAYRCDVFDACLFDRDGWCQRCPECLKSGNTIVVNDP